MSEQTTNPNTEAPKKGRGFKKFLILLAFTAIGYFIYYHNSNSNASEADKAKQKATADSIAKVHTADSIIKMNAAKADTTKKVEVKADTIGQPVLKPKK